ncbi:MAG TPA: hypothetical protein VGC41_13275, partial [Kofleriaceae bacterium]
MTRRAWIWLGLAVVIGFGLWAVPLFGVLGFEHAVVVAAFAVVAGLDLGASRAREAQTNRSALPEGSEVRTPVRGVLRSAGIALAIALIPGLLAAIHGLWTPTCDWWFGVKGYLLMPLPSAAFGAATGYAITIAVGTRTERHWYPHRSTWLAVVLPIVVLVVAGFLRFYREPPVFIYNALIGYFPGNMYDENIRLGMPLVWSRLEQLCAVVAIVCAVASYRVLRQKPLATIGVGVVGLAGAIILHSQAGALGYAVDAEDIQRALGGRVETAHFVIYYAATPDIIKDLPIIEEDHELRYAEVVAEIGAAPEGKLESYYFANAAQKADLFGARNVEMAKPWRHAIYIDHRAFPHSSLRHEIGHAVASAFGDRWFGLAAKHGVMISPGLVEGLAVALDWPGGYDRLTPHESVRVMQVMGVQPTIRELLSINFFTVSPARSYQTAGSFLHFLLEKYGPEKLRALYHSGGEFADVYGISLTELEGQWRTMIEAIVLPPEVIEGTKERFRGGSVFARPCPHAIPARREQATTALTHGDRKGALALMREVCVDAPDEPRHRIELGDVLSIGDASEISEARAIWTAIAGDEAITSSLRAEALEHMANRADADTERLALIQRAQKLPLNLDERRQLDAKAFVLTHDGPATKPLHDYFFGKLDDVMATAQAAVTAEPELGLAHYLYGLQKTNAADWATSATELDLALMKGLPGPGFVRN